MGVFGLLVFGWLLCYNSVVCVFGIFIRICLFSVGLLFWMYRLSWIYLWLLIGLFGFVRFRFVCCVAIVGWLWFTCVVFCFVCLELLIVDSLGLLVFVVGFCIGVLLEVIMLACSNFVLTMFMSWLIALCWCRIWLLFGWLAGFVCILVLAGCWIDLVTLFGLIWLISDLGVGNLWFSCRLVGLIWLLVL